MFDSIASPAFSSAHTSDFLDENDKRGTIDLMSNERCHHIFFTILDTLTREVFCNSHNCPARVSDCFKRVIHWKCGALVEDNTRQVISLMSRESLSPFCVVNGCSIATRTRPLSNPTDYSFSNSRSTTSAKATVGVTSVISIPTCSCCSVSGTITM